MTCFFCHLLQPHPDSHQSWQPPMEVAAHDVKVASRGEFQGSGQSTEVLIVGPLKKIMMIMEACVKFPGVGREGGFQD